TREAARRGIPLPRAGPTSETPGRGVRGTVDGIRCYLVSGGPLTVALQAEGEKEPRGRILLGDMIREDAPRTVTALRQLGLEPVLLSGDHAEVAERIATEAGIESRLAQVGPEAKAAWIRARQAEGHRVLFAGDGLNDGPALAAADVGIAMAGGATSSILVADGIVSAASLAPVVAGVRAGRAVERTIRVSQRWSIAYNVLAVGAAAAGWINPLVAAVLMPLSSVTVIWNAMGVERTLRRLER
ncbi:MAG TPA: HAD-IC family P-type ATPase, partial [Gemmatimonadales bacterium]|nr:HAD-IC family P-type ATPase [Gemmatimonadales bacterium]